MATLLIFAGLPGTGKTTLSQRLASRILATHLRVDTIEQSLRDLCGLQVIAEGYRLAYRVAADNLRLGLNVIADSCNPIEETRSEWERVAIDSRCEFVNIEIVCSDRDEHRRRVETRTPTLAGFALPTWEAVENRTYHDWSRVRIVIDTAGRSESRAFAELCQRLNVTVDAA